MYRDGQESCTPAFPHALVIPSLLFLPIPGTPESEKPRGTGGSAPGASRESPSNTVNFRPSIILVMLSSASRGVVGPKAFEPDRLAGLFAHNLTRELQMRTEPQFRRTTAKRAALWAFERLDTLQNKLIRRAGRFTRPQGRLTLTISGGWQVKERLLHCLETLKPTPQTG